jgi:2-polyprenyl-3-methyl-5-hydroxy-6-metoxy-1,4-benzoquinol methylase
MSLCPVCERADLVRQDQTVDLVETLAGWEAATSARFPPSLWARFRALEKTVLHRCPACRFGRFEPVVAGDADFYRAIATDEYYNVDKWEFERAIRRIVRSEARSVLDAGCGSGHFLTALRDAAPDLQLVGSEMDTSLLGDVRAKGFETISGDLDSVARSPDRFDVVCAFQTLEHVEDPLAFLLTYLGRLQPNGELILSTPDQDGPIRHFAAALTEVPPHHVTRWTSEAFETLLPRLGLDCVLVEREPLPAYLFDAYLPVVWREGCWPAEILDPLATAVGESAVAFGSECLRKAQLRRVHNVPGHTILAVGRKRS